MKGEVDSDDEEVGAGEPAMKRQRRGDGLEEILEA